MAMYQVNQSCIFCELEEGHDGLHHFTWGEDD